MTKTTRITSLTASLAIIGMLVLPVFLPSQKAYAANLTISSPSNGQTFSGNEFTISGVAEADATIAIIQNGRTVAQTRSDSSGNWSKDLSGLPDGDNTITVRSIINTGSAYFTTFVGGTIKINQLRLTDNAINTAAGLPVSSSALLAGLMPSPVGDVYMAAGIFGDSTVKPAKFQSGTPADPVTVSGNYPDDAGPNAGAFNESGTKYFSPNLGLTTVSVVDVATNNWEEDIQIPGNPVTAWRGPNGKVYITYTTNSQGVGLAILNPADNTITKTISDTCGGNAGFSATVSFSTDANYPYYFQPCMYPDTPGDLTKILKRNISDDQVVQTMTVDFPATQAISNLDNTKLYLVSSAAIGGNDPVANQIKVMNIASGTEDKVITATNGVVGVLQSPDFQHLYMSTPGSAFDQTGIDILDMFTDQIEHIATDDPAVTISAKSTSATLSNVNVAVVLGVKTTSSQLAKTGLFVALASPLGLFMVAAAMYTFSDYKRHKQPLLEADPSVSYSYFHHLKVVSFPLAKYRLSVSVDRKVGEQSDKVSRF